MDRVTLRRLSGTLIAGLTTSLSMTRDSVVPPNRKGNPWFTTRSVSMRSRKRFGSCLKS